jgi:hypothetical protein
MHQLGMKAKREAEAKEVDETRTITESKIKVS